MFRTCTILALASAGLLSAQSTGWVRHTIDISSKGADGVRLADLNNDGRPDIITGWEEGGLVRAYLNPGPQRLRLPWPQITIAEVPSVEDAVLADIDSDGALDAVSAAEGKTRAIFLHWGPRVPTREGAWRSFPLPASLNISQWMFTLPMQIDGRFGLDIVAGGKNEGAKLGWFEAPSRPRELENWKFHSIRDAGWIMSLISADMDGDQIPDILFSDRKGSQSGVFWVRNPAPIDRPHVLSEIHPIGALGREVMFIDYADLDRDGLTDVVAAVKPRDLIWFRRLDQTGLRWQAETIQMPQNAGGAKAVRVADLDLDGQPEIAFTCESTPRRGIGVGYMKRAGAGWTAIDISGGQGVKFDLIEFVDLDGDGDLDLITCEETAGLGVVWYENPARSRGR